MGTHDAPSSGRNLDAVGNWSSLTTGGGSPETRTHNAQNTGQFGQL